MRVPFSPLTSLSLHHTFVAVPTVVFLLSRPRVFPALKYLTHTLVQTDFLKTKTSRSLALHRIVHTVKSLIIIVITSYS